MLNVDRVRPPNDDCQDATQFGSSGDDDLQAFIDELDLMISSQDVIQYFNFNVHVYTYTYVHTSMYVCM